MIHFRAVVAIAAVDAAAAREIAREIDRHFGAKAGSNVDAPYVTVVDLRECNAPAHPASGASSDAAS